MGIIQKSWCPLRVGQLEGSYINTPPYITLEVGERAGVKFASVAGVDDRVAYSFGQHRSITVTLAATYFESLFFNFNYLLNFYHCYQNKNYFL